MIEVPIVVNDNEVNVATFIDSIDLQVDVGPPGVRGSVIFSGVGSPESKTMPPSPTADPVFQGVSEIRINDFYIDVASSGYAWLWQYQPSPLGWTLVTRLNPPTYSSKHLISFTSGASSAVSIPLEDILGTTTTSLTAEQFVVNVNAIPTTPGTTTYIVNPTSIAIVGSNLDVVFHLRALSTTAVSVPGSVTNLNCQVSIGVSA